MAVEETGPVRVASPPRRPRIRREVSGIHRNMDATWDDAVPGADDAPGDEDKTGELEWRREPEPQPEPEPEPEPRQNPWASPPDAAQEATNIIRAIPEGLLDDD